MTNIFIFQLGAEVTLQTSGETGFVIGRAEYLTTNPSYLIRYKAADGRQVETWWSEDAILAAE